MTDVLERQRRALDWLSNRGWLRVRVKPGKDGGFRWITRRSLWKRLAPWVLTVPGEGIKAPPGQTVASAFKFLETCHSVRSKWRGELVNLPEDVFTWTRGEGIGLLEAIERHMARGDRPLNTQALTG